MAGRAFLAIAGLSGALSVGVDAASRHLLAGDVYRLDLAATSARYGIIHAVALLGVAALLNQGGGHRWLVLGGWFFVAGLALFCGSLDLIAAGSWARLAVLTPWGGSAFIAGWLSILVWAIVPPRSRP